MSENVNRGARNERARAGESIASVPLAPPRSTVAARVLISFVVTLLAFAVTVGWGVIALRQSAQDTAELAGGYVPVSLQLAQLRATHSTLSTLVDGIRADRNLASTRVLLESLVSDRRTKFQNTKNAVTQYLVASQDTHALGDEVARALSVIEEDLVDDDQHFDRLFAAIATGDQEALARVRASLSEREHAAGRKLQQLAERVANSIDNFSSDARWRALRALYALGGLALLTLAVGVAVSIHTRRLLAPLARVTERARAVARGDMEPREVLSTTDEIGQLATQFEQMVAAVGKAQALALSNERLAAIGKMAAHVTHEIRNPLSSIGLNLDLLEEELAIEERRDEVRSLLTAVKREVERLEHLSDEYLRVARLPSPRMEPGDLTAALEEIVSFARPEMERAACNLSFVIAEPLPPVSFDESQLRQALLNLLRNAREAMPNGGPIDVRVSLLSSRAEGAPPIAIDVEDRGIGIGDDIRARVFDPFFSTKGEGTGLGLAITRHIVEAHGGTLRCDPREGGGTRFRIILPTSTRTRESFIEAFAPLR